MKRSSMGWLEACFLKNTRDIIIFWLAAGILFGLLVGDLKGVLFFGGVLAFIFVMRKGTPRYCCGKCSKGVDHRDKYCSHCGEKF